MKSVLRESNPPRLTWKPGTSAARQVAHNIQAEGEGVEPSRLVARPLSRRLPSPIGLPFRLIKSGRPDLNLRSRTARGTRNTRLSHVLNFKAPSGNRTRASAMARQQA